MAAGIGVGWANIILNLLEASVCRWAGEKRREVLLGAYKFNPMKYEWERMHIWHISSAVVGGVKLMSY